MASARTPCRRASAYSAIEIPSPKNHRSEPNRWQSRALQINESQLAKRHYLSNRFDSFNIWWSKLNGLNANWLICRSVLERAILWFFSSPALRAHGAVTKQIKLVSGGRWNSAKQCWSTATSIFKYPQRKSCALIFHLESWRVRRMESK